MNKLKKISEKKLNEIIAKLENFKGEICYTYGDSGNDQNVEELCADINDIIDNDDYEDDFEVYAGNICNKDGEEVIKLHFRELNKEERKENSYLNEGCDCFEEYGVFEEYEITEFLELI